MDLDPEEPPLRLHEMAAAGDVVELRRLAALGVQALVELGATVEVHNAYGLMPLHIAAVHGHTETVQVLVQLGTLIQQQLVVRVSSEAVLEGMRLRCEAPQDTLKAAAEELKFDLDRYFEDVAGS